MATRAPSFAPLQVEGPPAGTAGLELQRALSVKALKQAVKLLDTEDNATGVRLARALAEHLASLHFALTHLSEREHEKENKKLWRRVLATTNSLSLGVTGQPPFLFDVAAHVALWRDYARRVHEAESAPTRKRKKQAASR